METAERMPAEVFPLAELIGDEMAARGWTTDDVAARLGDGGSFDYMALFKFMLMLSVQREKLIFGDDFLNDLSMVFGVDRDFFGNIDAAWRAAPEENRRYYSPPDELFGPISRRCFIRAV